MQRSLPSTEPPARAYPPQGGTGPACNVRHPSRQLTLLAAGLLVFAGPIFAGQVVDELVVKSEPKAELSCPAQKGVDYACLSAALTAASVPPPAPEAAIDAAAGEATTPSRVGTFSYTATAQRMGSNFGRSAKPYRPPATVFASPITARPPAK